jgi:hypothetical protein
VTQHRAPDDGVEPVDTPPDTHIPLEEHNYLMRSVKRIVWTFFIAFVGILVVGGFNVWYTQHVDHARVEAQRQQSEQSRGIICAVIQGQIDVYKETPPVSKTGQNIADTWRQLGVLLKCKETK